MGDLLPALHDAYDSSLRLVVAVCCYTLMSLLVLGFGFLSLDLIDLDTVFGMRKAEIDREGVVYVDVLSFRRFTQDAVAGTG